MAPLQRGRSEATLALSHVNTWAQMPNYFFDGEFSRLELRLAHGLTARTEVGVHIGVLRRSGGRMDAFIEGFHQLFGITQARRDRHPRNALRVSLGPTDAPTCVLRRADTGVGVLAPTLMVRELLVRRAGWLATVELHLQPPIGDGGRAFVARGPNLLLAAATQMPLPARIRLHLAAGLVVATRPGTLYGMPLAATQKVLVLGLSLPVGQRWALTAHYMNQDGIVEGARFAPLHLSTHEFVAGAMFSPGPRSWVLEGGLIENSVHDANTPDFGVSVAVRYPL